MRKLIYHFTIIVLFSFLASCATDKLSLSPQVVAMSPESNAKLGMRYRFGRGVKQNDKQALYYLKKAADDNHAGAQNEVAYLYAAGKGTERDYEKALLYYQLAAYQEVASAQFNLGLMYAKGLGTEPNQADAMKWIDASAKQGFYPAQQYLEKHPHAQAS